MPLNERNILRDYSYKEEVIRRNRGKDKNSRKGIIYVESKLDGGAAVENLPNLAFRTR